jgi:hypothetical protein
MKTSSKLSQVRKLFNDGMLGGVDMVSAKKTGEIVFRRGYFYTLGMTSETFLSRVTLALQTAGIEFTVVEIGNHWAPFRGGYSIARGSHFFVVIR